MTIGLFCGWQYTMHAIRALGSYLRFDPAQLKSVRYRGGGPVGKLHFEIANGDVRELNRRVDYSAQVAFDRSFNLQRCHVCVNHSNMLADLAVGDAWLPETVFSKTGVSLLVARSQIARTVIVEVEGSGAIRLADADESAIERSQGRNVAFGDAAYSLAEALADRNVPHPVINAPNRLQATPLPRKQVVASWELVLKKRSLQQRGKYWWLWVRKGTLELPTLLRRLSRSRLIRRYVSGLFARSPASKQVDGLDGFL